MNVWQDMKTQFFCSVHWWHRFPNTTSCTALSTSAEQHNCSIRCDYILHFPPITKQLACASSSFSSFTPSSLSSTLSLLSESFCSPVATRYNFSLWPSKTDNFFTKIWPRYSLSTKYPQWCHWTGTLPANHLHNIGSEVMWSENTCKKNDKPNWN